MRDALRPFLGTNWSTLWVEAGFKNVSLAGAHLGTLDTGSGGVSACRRDQRTKRGARDTAEVELVKKARKLEYELKAVMELEEVRWLDFLDEIPGETSAPEPVENVEVEEDGPGRLFIDWAPSMRAERYLIEILVVGTDPEFRRLVTVQDTSAVLADLPPGARVKLRVVAANGAGESAPSAFVDNTVPVAEAA